MMEKRLIGSTGKKATLLGFGAMRLPMQEINGQRVPKEEESIETMLKAFQSGINIIDTAYHYGNKNNEAVVGKALKEWRHRKTGSDIYLSTKFPTLLARKQSDYRFYLEKQLKKLDVESIDFYHFHALNDEYFNEKVIKLDLISEAIKAKQEGLIKHICFSFHDTVDVMKKIIDTGVFEVVLCQYNILDPSLASGIQYAKEKGLGVFIMGPLGGGRIKDLGYFKDVFGQDAYKIHEIALKFIFSNPDISVTFSGMENIKMFEENFAVADKFTGQLASEEQNILDHFLHQKKIADLIPCTNCKYCLPCPNDVAIPKILKIFNYDKITGLDMNASWQYKNIPFDDDSTSSADFYYRYNNKNVDLKEISDHCTSKLADSCTECGQCEEQCPQGISIIKEIKEAHERYI